MLVGSIVCEPPPPLQYPVRARRGSSARPGIRSCQIPRRSDLIGSDLHGGTTRFACDRRYPLYPTPPYYIYYTSGIWHRGAGRRTARIGTSSVPTDRDGVRNGTKLDLYAIRCGTSCVLTDRDGVRAYGSGRRATRCGPGRRAKVGTAFERRCGYDRRVRTVRFGTMCERDGAGAAGVAGRVHGCCASSRRDRRRRGPLRPTTCETGGLDRGATCERTDDVLLHVAVPHQKQ